MHFRAAKLVIEFLAPHSSRALYPLEALSHILEPVANSITQQESFFSFTFVLLFTEVANSIQRVGLNFLQNFDFSLFCLWVNLTDTLYKVSSSCIVLLDQS
jgi:hypothetical protein